MNIEERPKICNNCPTWEDCEGSNQEDCGRSKPKPDSDKLLSSEEVEKVIRDALWNAYCFGRADSEYIPEEVLPDLMKRCGISEPNSVVHNPTTGADYPIHHRARQDKPVESLWSKPSKDTECQARIEEIFKEIEELVAIQPDRKLCCGGDAWLVLKSKYKQESIKK